MKDTSISPSLADRLFSRPEIGATLNAMDIGVLLFAMVLSAVIWFATGPTTLAWFPIVVVGHFFLFCNVFRLHQRLELVWAICFVGNCLAWSLTDQFSWSLVLLTQTPTTVLLIFFEMRKPRYHGILCRRINHKHLDDYLERRRKKPADCVASVLEDMKGKS